MSGLETRVNENRMSVLLPIVLLPLGEGSK